MKGKVGIQLSDLRGAYTARNRLEHEQLLYFIQKIELGVAVSASTFARLIFCTFARSGCKTVTIRIAGRKTSEGGAVGVILSAISHVEKCSGPGALRASVGSIAPRKLGKGGRHVGSISETFHWNLAGGKPVR